MRLVIVTLLTSFLQAQTFEVASVRPSGGPAEATRDGVTRTSWGTKGGPGTNDQKFGVMLCHGESEAEHVVETEGAAAAR